MRQESIDNLIKRKDTKAFVDNKNPQPRRVIVSAGKIRVQVGAPNGKTNN